MEASTWIRLTTSVLVGFLVIPFGPGPAWAQASSPSTGGPDSPATPDLPDLVGQLMPPVDVGHQASAAVQVRIGNGGSASGAATAQVVLRSDGTTQIVQTLDVPPLAPGDRFTSNFTWPAPSGTSRLELLTDPDNRVVEANESNNLASTWVHRAYEAPIDVSKPFRFETENGDPAQPPTVQSSWENGTLRLTVGPRGSQSILALVHQRWLDSRLDMAALDNVSFTLVRRDGEDYYSFSVPAGQSTAYTFRPFAPAIGRSAFGRGSFATLFLDERAMGIRLLETPSIDATQETVATPNGTVVATTTHNHHTLSIDFTGAHDGQGVWINASYLAGLGIARPAVRHDDGAPVPVTRVGDYWLLQPAHFSVLHVFDSGSEMSSVLNPMAPNTPYSDVSWDSTNRRMKITSDRRDTLDVSAVRDFVPHAQYFITSQFGVTTQGNWQAMYPLIVANRAERTSPSGSDNYGAPKSFGFFYYSRDDYQDLPQIQAYYMTAGGVKTTVWTWTAPTYEGWDVTLKLIVGATSTTFELFSSNGSPSTSVSNTNIPLSYSDVISFGSEDLDTDAYEQPAVGWVDSVYLTPMVGNLISEDFNSLSGWTLSGSATCCTGGYLQLTDNAASQAGRAYYNLGMNAARFSAEFSFYAGPNAGGADGLTFMFYKNMAYTPANGGRLGFSDTNAGTSGHEGYGIEVDTWQNTEFNDIADDYLGLIRDDVDQHVTLSPTSMKPVTVTDGQYHTVNVEVWDSKIYIYYDNILTHFSTALSFSRTFSGIGFSAGTGGYTNYHRIDYVRVSTAATAPNSAPTTPSLSSPSNGATGVSTGPTLDWTDSTDPDGDSISYLLYFGTSSSPPYYANPSASQYTLSGLSTSTTYYWRVVAQDNKGAQSGTTATWSFTTTAPAGNGLSQNFDSGANPPSGWTLTASSADPRWHVVSRANRYYSASYALWYGQDSTLNYDNGATNYGYATSPSFVVPSANPTLTFRSWFASETGYYDRREIYVSTNGGGSWTCVANSYTSCSEGTGTPVALSTTSSTWVPESISLGAFAGQTVLLRFEFNTIDSVANNYEGWYVDDVVVASVANNPPNVPTNPSPASGATGQPLSVTLSWTGGDPDAGQTVTYQVYLGTTNPPPLTPLSGCNGITATSCASGSLAFSTTYYWKVRSSDPYASTDGPVWSFTMKANSAPNPATSPSPASGSTARATSFTAAWTSGGDPDGQAVTFTVYRGTSNPPTATVTGCVGVAGTTCSFSGLSLGTVYYWKVSTSDGSLSTDTSVWSFTTNYAPSTPTNPSPADAATGVAWTVTASWVGGDLDGQTVTSTVYRRVGTSGGFSQVCQVSATSCPAWTGLSRGTTYQWYVVATDSMSASTQGPTWTFTARPNTPPSTCLSLWANYLSVEATNYCTDGDADAVTYTVSWGDSTTTTVGPTTSYPSIPAHLYGGAVYCPSGTASVTITANDGYTSVTSPIQTLAINDNGHDVDGDVLIDCRERIQGTSDSSTDTDGDTLSDYVESQWWQTAAIRDALFCNPWRSNCAYPNPIHKDVYVEMDHMGADHLPTDATLRAIVDVFATSPNANNPDGQQGIRLHLDAGPALALEFDLGGGSIITNAAGTPIHDDNLGTATGTNCANYDWTEFYQYKNRDQDNRAGSNLRANIYHYMIWAHSYADGATCPAYSGLARGIPHKDFFVSLGGWTGHGTQPARQGTFAHELGHVLGLQHGGNEGTNSKPNYLSVLGYVYQIDGVPRVVGNPYYGYSSAQLPVLSEGNLNENVGLNSADANDFRARYQCGGVAQLSAGTANGPIDWNCDRVFQNGVRSDLNNEAGQCTAATPGNCQQLNGYRDWGNLAFTGLTQVSAPGIGGHRDLSYLEYLLMKGLP